MSFEDLFGNHLIILFVFICLGLFVDNDSEGHKKLLVVYISAFTCCLFKIAPVKYMIPAVILTIFLILEYMEPDKVKGSIVCGFWDKCIDFIYLFFFRLYVWAFVISLILLSQKMRNITGEWFAAVLIISLIITVIMVHKSTNHSMQVKEYKVIYKLFEQYPINLMPTDSNTIERLRMLSMIEDKSYFQRQDSYNFLSVGYLKYIAKKLRHVRKISPQKIVRYIGRVKLIRGYSTIEMQLIRQIGLVSGYNHVFQRKIYELFYSRLFFNGLEKYYERFQYTNREYYRQYLIWVYYHTVPVCINGKRFTSIRSAVGPIETCRLESLCIAILALSNRTEKSLEFPGFAHVLVEYQLDLHKLADTRERIGEKNCKIFTISRSDHEHITWDDYQELINIMDLKHPQWDYQNRKNDKDIIMVLSFDYLTTEDIRLKVLECLMQMNYKGWIVEENG